MELSAMKRRTFLHFCFIWLIVGLSTGSTAGQVPQISVAPDTGESIMKNVIARAKDNETLKRESLAYKRVYTRDNLNDNEQVTDREREEVASIALVGKEE